MSFGTFDDHMPFHRKWIALSNDAYAMGMRALLWSRSPGAAARPGYVTLTELRYFGGRIALKAFNEAVAELVDAGKGAHQHGILVPTEDGGFYVCSEETVSFDRGPRCAGKALRQYVLERDRSTCGLCGQPIDGPFHVDHILPWSHGGPTIADNLRATHQRCNLQRGATIQ